jgi:uncharacterized protein
MNDQTQTALITGGTSGIGLALARRFAREKFNLVIVARKGDELATVKAALEHEFGIVVNTIIADLSERGAATQVYDDIKSRKIRINVLVNNAGYAEYGLFQDIPLDRELSLMQLNMLSSTILLKLFLDEMVARNSGRILNVGSTASFMPGGPLMSVYYATKSYILSLTETLAYELKGTKVTVTALCPGPTRTRFQDKARINSTWLIRMYILDVDKVANAAFRGLMRGQTIVIPGWFNKLQVQLLRISPRKLTIAIIHMLQKRRDN